MDDSDTPVLLPTKLAPFRIGPDWLALSMSGPVRLLSFDEPVDWIGGRLWCPTTIRTRVMQRVYYLRDSNGRKLLTVAGMPYSRAVGPPDWMQVQFANETLHTGEFVEIYHTLRSMGFRYMGVTRLDLAADGIVGNGGDFNEPLQRAFDGKVEYFGKMHWQPRYEGRKRVNGAALGSAASNKWFRVYDKTRELKTAAAAHKAPYIRAAWEAALGFDPVLEGMQVCRFEFRTKGKEVRRYFPEESSKNEARADAFVESLYHQSTCADIFASMAAKVYDFRTPAERARDAVRMVEWDFGAVKDGTLRVMPRAPRTLALSTQAIKTTIKGLWQTSYVTNDTVWIEQAERMAYAQGLSEWLGNVQPAWKKELDAIIEASYRRGETFRLDALYKLRGQYPGNSD